MADWAWRFSLRLTRRVFFSRGGPSAFRRSAWGNFSVGRAPRSWQANLNASGCRSRCSGLALQFCGNVLPGNRVPEMTLRIATTVSRKDNWLVPPERNLCTLLTVCASYEIEFAAIWVLPGMDGADSKMCIQDDAKGKMIRP